MPHKPQEDTESSSEGYSQKYDRGHVTSKPCDSKESPMITTHDDDKNFGEWPIEENRKPAIESTSKASTNQASYSPPSPHSSWTRGEGKDEREDGRGPVRMQEEDGASSCCELSKLKRLPQCTNDLGDLSCDQTHTVLVHVEAFNRGVGLLAVEGRDLWDSNFVKMPCSERNVTFPSSGQASRWSEISRQLKALAKKKSVSVEDVKKAIFQYNPKYRSKWSFETLSAFVKSVAKSENNFDQLFPKIAALALNLPKIVKKAIPLLQSGYTAAITLSQYQISCLLANAFFCTFPHRNTTSPTAEYNNYPSINFNSLFGNFSKQKLQKLRAIMHYFGVMTDDKSKPEGLVTFQRHCLKHFPDWKNSEEKLHKLHVSSRGSIEDDGEGMLQVDFACSSIGGGVLGSGLVQEEILFLINPELIVSRLFTEKLADNECLVITGSQKFSRHEGFSDTFEWVCPYEEKLERDKWCRLQRQIVAIDAINFRNRYEQYSVQNIVRELNKAYCGFQKHHRHKEPAIATGKWGCGAFNGDAQLKAVIQLMAAAKAGRGLAFFTFTDVRLERSLEQIYHLLVTEGITVGKLFRILDRFGAEKHKHGDQTDLFEFIRKSVHRSKSHL
ncbi:poly(ADP-ribose) glycohydrolase [Brachyistius frenatus]|uniref:poly(ADP-ribose) glycohydrolase n=1 Tax=Brachyistius frenatus TaxID=100188 RepID=UPI0037E8D0D7